MKTATRLDDLLQDYLRFKSLDEERMDGMSYVQQYERLLVKIENAGYTFYELSTYAQSRMAS